MSLEYDRAVSKVLALLEEVEGFDYQEGGHWRLERHEQRIAMAAADHLKLTAEHWHGLSEQQRIPWLERLVAVLEQKADAQGDGAPPGEVDTLALAPGGFTFRGRLCELTGRPLAMLKALLESPHRSATACQLRQAMGVDEECVSFPEQVVRDTARKLRGALRKAIVTAGADPPKDPLPSTGKGADLAYRLNLANLSQ